MHSLKGNYIVQNSEAKVNEFHEKICKFLQTKTLCLLLFQLEIL